VILRAGGSNLVSAVTEADEDGKFEFADLATQPYALRIGAPAFSFRKVEVAEAKSRDVDLGAVALQVHIDEGILVESDPSMRNPPAKVTPCQLAKNPESFNRRMVEVKATIRPAEPNMPIILQSQDCSQDVWLFMPDGDSKRDPLTSFSSLQTFRDALRIREYLGRGQTVTATFYGWFYDVRKQGTSESFRLILISAADIVENSASDKSKRLR
jgi:hypothetical protein